MSRHKKRRARTERGGVKRTIKDSIFTHMLKIRELLLMFYKGLFPDDVTVTEDDLRYVTLDSELTNSRRNDIGFLVRDRLLVLAEEQTTWSENMPLRMMLYASATYDRLIRDDPDANIYSSKAIALPRPELYVIHPGPRDGRPDTLTLSGAHFGGERSDIEVTVHMVYGCGGNTIIDQYIEFTQLYDKWIAKHGRSLQTLKDLIEYCKEHDILKRYLETRESEVADLMLTILTEDYRHKMEIKASRAEARAEALDEGIAIGDARGRAEGRAEGRALVLQELIAEGSITEDVARRHRGSSGARSL